MSPLEKAQQLKESFNNSLTAKDCCLVCIEEILQNVYDDRATIGRGNLTDKEYWTKVKEHIEEL